jgi:hypothetical protein
MRSASLALWRRSENHNYVSPACQEIVDFS